MSNNQGDRSLHDVAAGVPDKNYNSNDLEEALLDPSVHEANLDDRLSFNAAKADELAANNEEFGEQGVRD